MAVAGLFVASVLEGVTGAAVPVVLAVMLVLPGDLTRRAVRPRRSFATLETLAVDFALSCTVLTVMGGLLAAVGGLTRGWLVVAFGLGAGVMVMVARRRGDEASSVSTTVQAFSIVVVLASTSVCLFHIEPLVGDRIFLGQLRTAVEVMRAGRVPATIWTFGTETPFPVHYLFYDLIISVTALSGGFERWSELKLLAAGLRLTQLGFFCVVWYLVGRELLRRFRADVLTQLCAVGLPLLLLFNAGLVSKFREPLVEGFGVCLLGIAVWAIAQSTGAGRLDRRWWFVLSVISTSLLVGIHFPVFVEAVILIGAWLLVAAPPTTVRGAILDPRRRRRFGRRVQAVVWPAGIFLAGAVGALLAIGLLGPGSPVDLAAPEVSQETVFRAYKLYVGDPLSTKTLSDFVSPRWSRSFMLTSGPFVRPAVMLGVPSVVGLLWVSSQYRGRRRMLGWLLLAGVLTLAYVGVGLILGRTDLTPWNAVTRNGYYFWFPVALGITLGLRAALSLFDGRGDDSALRRRAMQFVRVAAVVVVGSMMLPPLVDTYGGTLRDHGWIAEPRITADGERGAQLDRGSHARGFDGHDNRGHLRFQPDRGSADHHRRVRDPRERRRHRRRSCDAVEGHRVPPARPYAGGLARARGRLHRESRRRVLARPAGRHPAARCILGATQDGGPGRTARPDPVPRTSAAVRRPHDLSRPPGSHPELECDARRGR